MSTLIPYKTPVSRSVKSWYKPKPKTSFIRDYVTPHDVERSMKLVIKWRDKVVAEDRIRDIAVKIAKRQILEKGNPDALLDVFDKLEKNEDLASSIEGITKWTRTLGQRDVDF